MPDPLNVVLSGISSALAAIFSAVVVERLGGTIGGVLATIPTTIIPASLTIYYQTKNMETFTDAMFTVASGMLLNTAYLYYWKIVPNWIPSSLSSKKRLSIVAPTSLLFWTATALLYVLSTRWLQSHGIDIKWIGSTSLAITIIFGLIVVTLQPAPAPSGKKKTHWVLLIARGVTAATAVMCASLLATVSGLAAGMASVFPAIYSTTMITVWFVQGESVTNGAVGPMMLGGVSVTSFALNMTWLIPLLGPALAALVAFCLSVVVVSIPLMLLMRFLSSRNRKHDEKHEMQSAQYAMLREEGDQQEVKAPTVGEEEKQGITDCHAGQRVLTF
ncbi:hypothetical protein PROFUN_08897 [Planoprotostelium fungivorum]|uniref:Uncharacterized protein n=1 Tax=Planoprotostelium fungivorum TaxID=1890364 RepID=A0A2P6NIT2_9EUKA|nr:hypothetical protein PROFUN_08897 [Planoprotostelium fungivorum]